MKFWIVYLGLIGLILFVLCLVCSGCHGTWQGIQQDLGIHKPEPKPVVVPTPGEQLWQAAKRSNWLVTVSILGIAAGVFALVNGAVKLGTASIASASVSLFMALAVARFAFWMALFGLIGSIASALFSILARRKALVEIIKGVQTYRNENGNSAVIDKTLDEVQTSSTKQIVQVIKNGLKLNGEIV
jgi:hypothetical protein